ncbi:MAG TPA: 7-carboxy-7-deazaguanine synthase [Burkholderiales bacterium]|nr:7-carboxy-7-deazaguanine synthase [Burkholderiales bacterium]
MTYSVKEIFYTLQGEGANTGRAAVFCRFAGCNLWSGIESDRSSAVCKFCDTDFVGTDGTLGGKFQTSETLGEAIARLWPRETKDGRFVVLTGGEPLLQVNAALIAALHDLGFRVAIETNGTLDPPKGLDWICVSPKAGASLRVTQGDEIKVVIPQPGLDLFYLSTLPFAHRFVQPMDGPHLAENARLAVDWCLQNPQWRLSLQTHKMIGIR